ncbi:MAG: glycosyltransferase family 2 protein [Planctomycetes bacterium]|nr:glycosyltransferase family 2 protein [Planctomycetota bacterium]
MDTNRNAAPDRDPGGPPPASVPSSRRPLGVATELLGTRRAERADRGGPKIDVSVVIPLYNEVQNVRSLHSALSHALRAVGRSYELLLVDDGSTDGTRQVLRDLAAADPHLRVILFRRNCGQTPAMAAGFDHARGGIVVTMDGDLQNDPADIPRVVAELERGYDIVCGWRRHRKDAFATRLLPSMLANLLIRWTTGVPIHDTGCSLKAYRAWVVRSLTLYSDMHRFIAALGAGLGARVSEIAVRHHPRRYGRSKYGLGRIFRVVLDLVVIKMLIQFAAHPIRWFGILAVPLFVAFLLLLAMGFVKPVEGGITFESDYDIVLMSGAAVAAVFAFNVFLLGFLAELQLKASRFFRRRTSVAATEAAQ